MLLNPQRIGSREKQILAGLFLSKYDAIGLKKLGFDSFGEAFNVIGYALGSKPASIKNYRDEFDPLFPNQRKGWHKRPARDYCLKVFEEYKNLDFETFSGLVKSFVGYDENVSSEVREADDKPDGESNFAKRLITGLAAERYFESIHRSLAEFKGYTAEDTTRLGCGYDFRLRVDNRNDFLAVEVKGLKDRTGNLSLTPKEHEVAGLLGGRFFLFVVKNRKGDFQIDSVAIHVTTYATEALVRKCVENLQAGLKPLIVTLGDGVTVAAAALRNRGIADRVDVLDCAQFLTANLYERSLFQAADCKVTLTKLLERYNEIVKECESDPALRIRLESSA